MTIKAIPMYKDGFVQQPFVFGGEEGKDALDASIRYPQSLQNFVVDTGDEVILVDTGVPDDFAMPAPGPQTAFPNAKPPVLYSVICGTCAYARHIHAKVLLHLPTPFMRSHPCPLSEF